MHHRISKRIGATALLAMAGLLGTLLIAVPAAPAATINACQKKKGGTIRIVSSKTKCKKTEKKIKWSTTGSAGKNGTNGANGANGANGTNGAAGTNGATGVAGQPQKAFQFNVTSDTNGFLGNKVTALFSTSGVTVDLFCGNFVINFARFRATGPAGTAAQSGMAATRIDDTPTQVVQKSVYTVDVTTETTFAGLDSNALGELSNKAQVNAQIQTTGAIIVISASVVVGPSPSSCTVKGVAFSIPT